MTALGQTVFAVLVWGSILAVAAVFVFEAAVIAREAGWLTE